jgi:hypothetical protein
MLLETRFFNAIPYIEPGPYEPCTISFFLDIVHALIILNIVIYPPENDDTIS